MTRTERARTASEAGFSLVEGMIAALILLFVILGVLPLVSQSMLNNLQGNDRLGADQRPRSTAPRRCSRCRSTRRADRARPAATSLVTEEVFTLDSNRGSPSRDLRRRSQGDTALHCAGRRSNSSTPLTSTRTTALDTPLDGGADPGSVHIKRIRMEIANERSCLRSPRRPPGNYEIVAVTTY
jgi:Tfp pilus assembly protein PilV